MAEGTVSDYYAALIMKHIDSLKKTAKDIKGPIAFCHLNSSQIMLDNIDELLTASTRELITKQLFQNSIYSERAKWLNKRDTIIPGRLYLNAEIKDLIISRISPVETLNNEMRYIAGELKNTTTLSFIDLGFLNEAKKNLATVEHTLFKKLSKEDPRSQTLHKISKDEIFKIRSLQPCPEEMVNEEVQHQEKKRKQKTLKTSIVKRKKLEKTSEIIVTPKNTRDLSEIRKIAGFTPCKKSGATPLSLKQRKVFSKNKENEAINFSFRHLAKQNTPPTLIDTFVNRKKITQASQKTTGECLITRETDTSKATLQTTESSDQNTIIKTQQGILSTSRGFANNPPSYAVAVQGFRSDPRLENRNIQTPREERNMDDPGAFISHPIDLTSKKSNTANPVSSEEGEDIIMQITQSQPFDLTNRNRDHNPAVMKEAEDPLEKITRDITNNEELAKTMLTLKNSVLVDAGEKDASCSSLFSDISLEEEEEKFSDSQSSYGSGDDGSLPSGQKRISGTTRRLPIGTKNITLDMISPESSAANNYSDTGSSESSSDDDSSSSSSDDEVEDEDTTRS